MLAGGETSHQTTVKFILHQGHYTMQQFERMGLHSHIMPALEYLGHTHADQMNTAAEATVFDCRQLPVAFLTDTGQMVEAEAAEMQTIARLPHTTSYFEFDWELGVLAHEVDNYDHIDLNNIPQDTKPISNHIVFRVYKRWGNINAKQFAEAGNISPDLEFGEPAFGIIQNGYSDVANDDVSWPFLEVINANDRDEEMFLMSGGVHLLGVLHLLKDKLLASRFREDPAPKLNKARAKRNRPPVSSDSYVLDLNLGAIRREIAKSTPLRSHESPRLHWRRGHSRLLHRGSEFERFVWVSRCLVGDPERGYANKSYRLRHEMPMLEAS